MRIHLTAVLMAVFILPFLFPLDLPASTWEKTTNQHPFSQDARNGIGENAPVSNSLRFERALDELPLYFIPNQGQSDQRVSFYVQGSNQAIFFTHQGVTFALAGPLEPTEQALPADVYPAIPQEPLSELARQRWACLAGLRWRQPKRPAGGRVAHINRNLVLQRRA